MFIKIIKLLHINVFLNVIIKKKKKKIILNLNL